MIFMRVFGSGHLRQGEDIAGSGRRGNPSDNVKAESFTGEVGSCGPTGFGRASDQQRVHDRYPSGDGNSFSHRRDRRSVRDVLERPPLVRRYRASLAKRTSSPSGASSAAPALTVCLVMN